MRFRESRLYISVIPPLLLGFAVGVLSAIMGVGGGFILVPAMIYLLRMPTNVVVGTSLVQIIFVTATTTILQATSNYTVDMVLALILDRRRRHRRAVWRARRRRCCAASICACARAASARRRRAAPFRAHRAARRSLSPSRSDCMRVWSSTILMLLVLLAPARAEDLVSGLSQDVIEITSNYTGSDIVVFGDIERPADQGPRDIVVVIRGPDTTITVRKKDDIAGLWINHDQAIFDGMPSYYFVASTRPVSQIASPFVLRNFGLGLANLEPTDRAQPSRRRAVPAGADPPQAIRRPLRRDADRRGVFERHALPRPRAGARDSAARRVHTRKSISSRTAR